VGTTATTSDYELVQIFKFCCALERKEEERREGWGGSKAQWVSREMSASFLFLV
jgi:hypothetical protein